MLVICIVAALTLALATTFIRFDEADDCPILPSFRVGAMDGEPGHFLGPREGTATKRPDDAPLGAPMGALPLVGGVIAKPLLGQRHTDFKRFNRILHSLALNATRELNVLVLGGSMTSGRMGNTVPKNQSACVRGLAEFGYDPNTKLKDWQCDVGPPRENVKPAFTEQFDCKPCAWPARLEYWLRSAYPLAKVNVINLARGGMGTSSCVGLLGGLLKLKNLEEKIDVVLLNFVHNDLGYIASRSKVEKAQIRNDATLNKSEKERQSLRVTEKLESLLRKDHEALLRELLSLPKKPAVLEIELSATTGSTAANHAANGLYHAGPIQYYQVPALSWANAKKTVALNVLGHPSWHVHQFIADWIAYAWQRLAAHACSSLHPHQSTGGEVAASLGLLPSPKYSKGD